MANGNNPNSASQSKRARARQDRQNAISSAKRNHEPYFPFRNDVLQSRVVRNLTPNASKLFLYFLAQYRAKKDRTANNGDLSAVFADTGFNSETTLTKAKRELEASGLIRLTRQGARINAHSMR